MSAFELTTVDLESRNIASDCARIGARIESYRAREAVSHPSLIVSEQHEPPIPAERCDDLTPSQQQIWTSKLQPN